MVSHKDYSAELSEAYPDRGHPIADPQPGFVPGRTKIFLPPIDLGDVGYIQHNHGRFIRLFNVHKEPGIDGQPTIDQLPFGFEVLDRAGIRVQEGEVNKNLFKSRSVTQLTVEAGGSGTSIIPLHGAFNFKTTRQRGAILVTPGPGRIVTIDASPKGVKIYKEYATKHLLNWLGFFEDEGLDRGDLILVTGVDLTTSWATAVFTSADLETSLGLNVEYADVGGIRAAAKLSWSHDQAAMTNSTPHTAEGPNMEPNQAIFIRRLRAKRGLLGLALRANAEPRDPDVGDDEDPDDKSSMKMGDDDDLQIKMEEDIKPFVKSEDENEAGIKEDDSNKPDIEMEEAPQRDEFVDSLTPALEYILHNSNAQVALVHDLDIPTYNELATHKETNISSIMVTENGVGMLRSPSTPTIDRGLTRGAPNPPDTLMSPSVSVTAHAIYGPPVPQHGRSSSDTSARLRFDSASQSSPSLAGLDEDEEDEDFGMPVVGHGHRARSRSIASTASLSPAAYAAAHRAGDVKDTDIPLSARLAAYGESLALARRLKEESGGVGPDGVEDDEHGSPVPERSSSIRSMNGSIPPVADTSTSSGDLFGLKPGALERQTGGPQRANSLRSVHESPTGDLFSLKPGALERPAPVPDALAGKGSSSSSLSLKPSSSSLGLHASASAMGVKPSASASSANRGIGLGSSKASLASIRDAKGLYAPTSHSIAQSFAAPPFDFDANGLLGFDAPPETFIERARKGRMATQEYERIRTPFAGVPGPTYSDDLDLARMLTLDPATPGAFDDEDEMGLQRIRTAPDGGVRRANKLARMGITPEKDVPASGGVALNGGGHGKREKLRRWVGGLTGRR